MGKRRVIKAEGPRAGVKTTRVLMPRELKFGRRKLFYCEAGLGAPTILIHGLGASCRWWFKLFPELTSNNLRALAPDLPGFGRSSGPALALKEAARSVVEFADHLKLDQFFLCGHSMGGAIAAHIAADNAPRIRRLVLVDSAGVPGPHVRRAMFRLVQPWSWCPLSFYPTLVGDSLRAGPFNMNRAIRHIVFSDIRPQVRRVTVPTLLIWGSKDRLTPAVDAERLVAELKDGRLVVIEGARHIPQVSHASEVASAVVGFLREDLRSEGSPRAR